MVNKADLERILSRSEEEEIRRLYDGGLSREEHKRWDWENTYSIRFSVPVGHEELEAAYKKGMLSKGELKDGRYYWGICRNARVAMWSEKEQRFLYCRKDGRWKVEEIKHPADDGLLTGIFDGMALDIFCPWLEVAPLDSERIRSP